MAYDGDGVAALPRRLPSRKSVYNVLADAVNVDSPHEVMIVDRGLLRWAMAMTRTEDTTDGGAASAHKRETVVAPLRRYRIRPAGRRTTRRL